MNNQNNNLMIDLSIAQEPNKLLNIISYMDNVCLLDVDINILKSLVNYKKMKSEILDLLLELEKKQLLKIIQWHKSEIKNLPEILANIEFTLWMTDEVITHDGSEFKDVEDMMCKTYNINEIDNYTRSSLRTSTDVIRIAWSLYNKIPIYSNDPTLELYLNALANVGTDRFPSPIYTQNSEKKEELPNNFYENYYQDVTQAKKEFKIVDLLLPTWEFKDIDEFILIRQSPALEGLREKINELNSLCNNGNLTPQEYHVIIQKLLSDLTKETIESPRKSVITAGILDMSSYLLGVPFIGTIHSIFKSIKDKEKHKKRWYYLYWK